MKPYKWPLKTGFFHQHNALEIYPSCCIYWQFILFIAEHSNLFNHSPTEEHFGCFPCGSLSLHFTSCGFNTNKATVNNCIFFSFISFGPLQRTIFFLSWDQGEIYLFQLCLFPLLLSFATHWLTYRSHSDVWLNQFFFKDYR